MSSTSRALRSARATSTESSTLRPCCSPRPSASATADPTIAGSVTGTRSTNHTPSSKAPVRSAATASASRVLPTPPGPVAVTSRCALTASHSSARSLARPMNGFNGDGRPPSARLVRSARAVSAARPASARRSRTPSLRSNEDTWVSTVRTEMNSCAPISALLRCSPTRARISASRAEMPIVGVCLDTRPILPHQSRRRWRHRYVTGSVVSSVLATDAGPARSARRCQHLITVSTDHCQH